MAPSLLSGAAAYPLRDGDRLTWQASAAVTLLERFGHLLSVALQAVGDGDDAAFSLALAERDRLVTQLEPLLGALATARSEAEEWATPGAAPSDAPSASWCDEVALPGSLQALAVARILAPVDAALQHAQHLHVRLSDEVRGRATRRLAHRARTPGRDAAVALVR